MNQKKTCHTCHWYEDFNGVCRNGKSEFCADFPDEELACPCWENYDKEMWGENHN